MNYSFEYIDIILLAMIAGFIFLRLRGILGKRTGFDGKSTPQFNDVLKNINPKIKTKQNENFDQEVLKSAKPIVVDFWAEWCGPCKQIGPSLEEISNEMAEQVIIAKHNIDNEPNTPTKYGIRGIPTMLLFNGGELKATKVGATTKSNIVSWIKENI